MNQARSHTAGRRRLGRAEITAREVLVMVVGQRDRGLDLHPRQPMGLGRNRARNRARDREDIINNTKIIIPNTRY